MREGSKERAVSAAHDDPPPVGSRPCSSANIDDKASMAAADRDGATGGTESKDC
jgi:hypothetical protein